METIFFYYYYYLDCESDSVVLELVPLSHALLGVLFTVFDEQPCPFVFESPLGTRCSWRVSIKLYTTWISETKLEEESILLF